LFEAAMGLVGDEGARRLIGALGAAELVEIATADLGAAFDIDTPGDLATVRHSRAHQR